MEVMEDGNLMDKVLILIKRDFEYYTNKQSILQETICPGIAGGRLDFPRYASFAAIKLALWWEDEFVAGFRKNSGLIPKATKVIEDDVAPGLNAPIVKTSDPEKFISLVAKSSDQLLEHLHVLTQEALDHADLTVLMGTIGAAALLKNCLWFYIQSCTESAKNRSLVPLQTSYKQYQEMTEALAERLLDMHCRLLSLYILQDAESLDWENPRPFFESERGSYVIQMWWLYMQGTRQDLWSTVPPKMAQRVLAGMLNESLTILTVRYTQSIPSESRNKLLAVDISNLLLCVGQLLPSICNSADEVVGLSLNSQTKILRDIHAKCQELFICLVLRATHLDILYKVFRKGVDSIEIFRSRSAGPSPWVTLGLPHIFPEYPKGVVKLGDVKDNAAIALEIFEMLAQPQPNWSLLLKVLGMRDGKVLSILLNLAVKKISGASNIDQKTLKVSQCAGFLCLGDQSCKSMDSQTPLCTPQHYYDLVVSLTHILMCIGSNADFARILIPAIDGTPAWAQCLDRRQVWNVNNPPWYEAVLTIIKPFLEPIIPTVISAVQTGASMYQAMTIVLACLIQLWDCVDAAIPRLAFLLQDALPADIVPTGKSVLLQFLVGALYSELLHKSEETKKDVKFAEGTKEDSGSVTNIPLKRQLTLEHKNSVCSFDGVNNSVEAVALAVAEALCSIDEDNKHTEEIEDLLEQAKRNLEAENLQSDGCKRVEQTLQMAEVLVSDLLMTAEGKSSLKTVYHFLISNYEWLLQSLEVSEESEAFEPNRAMPSTDHLLHTMFHVGYRSFDQLLTGEWQPDWSSFFRIPMGLSIDRIWNQVAMRWEFSDINTSTLSAHDARVVLELTELLKQS